MTITTSFEVEIEFFKYPYYYFCNKRIKFIKLEYIK